MLPVDVSSVVLPVDVSSVVFPVDVSSVVCSPVLRRRPHGGGRLQEMQGSSASTAPAAQRPADTRQVLSWRAACGLDPAQRGPLPVGRRAVPVRGPDQPQCTGSRRHRTAAPGAAAHP